MKRWTIIAAALAVLGLLLAGCSITKVSSANAETLEYTIMKAEDYPEEVAKLLDENKEQEFQMTYQDGQYLYLLKGYGRQETGGYSIQVEDVSRWDNAVHLKTMLIGPPREEELTKEPSYPSLVIKMEYREDPVIFE
ncbi:MAG: protease complex subunit PrcB family protein [Lachnospiraceae bacterium]|jgi:hypothetical protein